MGFADMPVPTRRTIGPRDVHPSHKVFDMGLYSSDPQCVLCDATVWGRPEALVAACPKAENVPDLSCLSLPDDDAKRGEYPMADGLLDYFPNALAEVSKVSKIGNDQHNPGQPMHWARDKSTDHANKILRHLVDRGRFDGRGVRHTARLAWRALAMLQDELEAEEGFPRSRASKTSEPAPAAA